MDRKLEDGIPFQWHHHPEMELTLTLNCRGQRFIGDSAAAFEDGDLTLVGSNLPHSWVSGERLDAAEPFKALVIWFERSWLEQIGQSCAELAALTSLAAKSQRGLGFSADTRAGVRPMIEQLFSLEPQDGLLTLLRLLCRLSDDRKATPLASAAGVDSLSAGYERIDRVLHHIHSHYDRAVRIDDLASIAALSPSGLHRMFSKHVRSTISAYLINMRIGEACAQLSATDTPVGIISDDVGYESQANFNRHFLRLRGMTPRQYRNAFR